MYRKIYERRVKMWQSDAAGKRALKWNNHAGGESEAAGRRSRSLL